MFFIMHKLNENDIEFSYKIETDIVVEVYINEKGKTRGRIKTIFAYCIFNKLNENFEIDAMQSDPYLLNKDSKEMIHTYCKLLKILRDGDEFPPKIVIATG